ncbi:Uncharacterised protein [Bordetella pertussis]|nr:Uncharacterised protein [Bordetella pertussis]CFM29821.1 Uncharacterised protein [Bordetella pertussis]CFN13756.1 Uncharacterised protein [Bordetella pertussis]CFP58032.1 Uncharacterised protein [Bordetella pertussis]CFU00095.1 Uncharacterised protein [Bordetella pertussis]
MVSAMISGVPPYSQSPSVRLGKLVLPLASEPWHCAQVLRNSRWPISRAGASATSCSGVMPPKRSYTGLTRSASSACFCLTSPTEV